MTEVVPGDARKTRQRAAVRAALFGAPEFRSAQEIYIDIRARGEEVGLTTVYRTLQALADVGEIDTVRAPNGEHVYRHCSPTRHHHLICRHCARTVEVTGPTVDSWVATVAIQNGFGDVNPQLEMFGTCESCARER